MTAAQSVARACELGVEGVWFKPGIVDGEVPVIPGHEPMCS